KLPAKHKYDIIVHPGDFNDNKKIFPLILQWLRMPFELRAIYPAWYDLAETPKAKTLITKSVNKGIIALKKLNNLHKKIYTIHGNWEYIKENEQWKWLHQFDFNKLIEPLKNITCIDYKSTFIDTHTLIGFPCDSGGPEYPQKKLSLYS